MAINQPKPVVYVRAIPGHPGYAASRDGRIWSRFIRGDNRGTLGDKWRQLSPGPKPPYGHLSVGLRCVTHYVHSLVLLTFVGPCPDGMECCHNDGDPTNNDVDNLRWDTKTSNQADRIIHNTSNRGERHGMSTIPNETVVAIKELLRRHSAKKRSGIQEFLGEWFGVSPRTISKIKLGERRRNG